VAKKREYTDLTIESIEYQGHGITKPEGRVVFVDGVLPGEVVDVTVTRRRRDHAFARPTHWHVSSPERQEPFCSHFADCGGCTWQYLPYEAQLRYKQQFIADVLHRIGGIEDHEIQPIIGCESDRYYRNKLDYSFAPVRWLTEAEVASGVDIHDRRALGFHVKGRFDRVLDVAHCYLQEDPSNAIRSAAREIALRHDYSFHDPAEHTGLLRSIIIRTAASGTMVILTIGEDRPDIAASFLAELARRVPEVSSAWYIVNPTRNDDIGPHPAHHVLGDTLLSERCGHLNLAIHPKSFYQTNSRQAERLYGVVREWLDASGG
jgi:23S rRNA (uracil1939-C5)-methyltransferase